MRVDAYYAPAHPEEGVAEHGPESRAWLLCGLVLLPPVALDVRLGGFARPAADLAGPAPALALTWVARKR